MVRHEKNMTCGINMVVGVTRDGQIVRLPCCFCLPYLDTIDASTNQRLGSSRYLCCHGCSPVPTLSMTDAQDKPKYILRPTTCCFDCCIDCCAIQGGKDAKCCRLTWNIRDFATHEKIMDVNGNHPDGYGITDLWAGFKQECCLKKVRAMYFMQQFFPNFTLISINFFFYATNQEFIPSTIPFPIYR
jgi:hypothetical protein